MQLPAEVRNWQTKLQPVYYCVPPEEGVNTVMRQSEELEEYQNHFIRHCPILSVTVPSHPSLSHLIRHLPISSVTRHLSVEKKGFIG